LNLGNYLIWIRGLIEDGPPEVDPMGSHPRSVFSLGKQLRAAGLAALDRAKDARAGADRVVDPYVANLNLHVRRLEDRVARLEGGAK
jgi:hypothetical protein